MKRLNYIFMLLVATATLLTGCNKDDIKIIPELTINTALTIGAAEDSRATVVFEVNVDWTATVSYEGETSDWLTLSTTNGKAGRTELQLTVTANLLDKIRQAHITISYGTEKHDITVTQEVSPELKTNASEITIDAMQGSHTTITFEVNTDWTAHINYTGETSDWLTLETQSGKAGKIELELTATANLLDEHRQAVVTISYGNQAFAFNITQNIDPRTDITANFDPDFAKVLQEKKYISDATYITLANVKDVKELNVSGTYADWEAGKGLVSLKGVEYFESLTYLWCDYNQLTTLDISKNTNLTHLDCPY
ncbi:MAG: hypothetical protein K2M86_00185, partial [Odoribacter sp.]|nr:hypothetical protein [Odoribacter sp.]